MISDRHLSADFRLSEAPCWWLASEADVQLLQETAARILQPIRSHFGVPVHLSSWKWWSGCEPRNGVHAAGGTVDFVVADGLTRKAWEWGRDVLVPTGYIGRWIYEPERRDAAGVKTQGEHIHAAPRADMERIYGDGRIQVLEEVTEGQYKLSFSDGTGWGSEGDPIEIPGLDVTVGYRWPPWATLLLAGIGFGLILRYRPQEATQ